MKKIGDPVLSLISPILCILLKMSSRVMTSDFLSTATSSVHSRHVGEAPVLYKHSVLFFFAPNHFTACFEQDMTGDWVTEYLFLPHGVTSELCFTKLSRAQAIVAHKRGGGCEFQSVESMTLLYRGHQLIQVLAGDILRLQNVCNE